MKWLIYFFKKNSLFVFIVFFQITLFAQTKTTDEIFEHETFYKENFILSNKKIANKVLYVEKNIFIEGNLEIMDSKLHANEDISIKGEVSILSNDKDTSLIIADKKYEEKLINDEEIKLYPNPNNGLFYIDIGNFKNAEISIYDSLGKLVYIKSSTKIKTNEVQISNYSAGVYIVKVTEEGKTATRKLVIQ